MKNAECWSGGISSRVPGALDVVANCVHDREQEHEEQVDEEVQRHRRNQLRRQSFHASCQNKRSSAIVRNVRSQGGILHAAGRTTWGLYKKEEETYGIN